MDLTRTSYEKMPICEALKPPPIRKNCCIRVPLAAMFFLVIYSVQADTWRGTAPFCNGQCLPGETQIATSNSGNGATCWTGHKVLCRNAEPTCTALQTNASCYGIIEVCDNGYYEISGAWKSCSKFACGICFGFGKW